MIQGGSAANSQNQIMSDIFRKKFGFGGNSQSSVGPARCLFGSLDVQKSKEMVHQIESKNQWIFSKKWNFDITGNPNPPMKLQSQSGEEPQQHKWTEVYTEDEMAKCDRHRFETPLAPNSRSVPLLYAPTTEPLPSITEPVNSHISESIAIQTDQKTHMDQGTQVEAYELPSELFLPSNCKLRSFVSDDDQLSCKNDTRLECMESIPTVLSVKKERRLPEPLTIPPVSPNNHTEEDHFEDPDGDEPFDETLSPIHMNQFENSVSGLSSIDSHRTPNRRRNTIGGVFTFPPYPESPSSGMRCLRIRNGSPVPYSDETRHLKQRCITDYMPIKKIKISKAGKMQ